MALINFKLIEFQTLNAMNAEIERENFERSGPSRGYCSASNIGHACTRHLWYSYRWARTEKLNAVSLKTFANGHQQEALYAERLAKVPGVKLWTRDKDGKQFNKTLFGGHFKCMCDGIIKGLLEAPKTPHVWEHKGVNHIKFNKLRKLVEADEKSALKEWDPIYYAQAVITMHLFDLKRHFLTVSDTGGRDEISCRTEANPKFAGQLMQKAFQVFFDDKPPARVAKNPDAWACKFCQYKGICFEADPVKNPIDKNCRTCVHSTFSESGAVVCQEHLQHVEFLKSDKQKVGCTQHLFKPQLINITKKVVKTDPQDQPYRVHYVRSDGKIFVNERGQSVTRLTNNGGFDE